MTVPPTRADLLDRLGERLEPHHRNHDAVLVEGPAGSDVRGVLDEAGDRFAHRFGAVLRAGAEPGGAFGTVLDLFGATDLGPALLLELTQPAGLAGGPGFPVFAGPSDRLLRPGVVRLVGGWAAGRGGVLLVVDDVHAADAASVAVLADLLRRDDGAVTLLVGARPGRCPAALRPARVGPARLSVPPWTPDDVRAAFPGTGAVRAGLLARAGLGRPGLVAALAGLSTAQLGRLDRLPVPELADQVDRAGGGPWTGAALTADERLVAATAAVLGPGVEVEHVARVAALDVDRVVAALPALLAADVLEEHGGRVRFTHPVSRAAAYRWIPPGRRPPLHRRAAELVAGQAGTGPEEAADHLAACAAPGDTSAITTLLAAARRRLHHDPGCAERWALAAAGLVVADGDPRGDEARLLAAQALAAQGRFAEALTPAHALRGRGPYALPATVLAARCERAAGRTDVAAALLWGARSPGPAGSGGSPEGSVAPALDVELDAVDLIAGDLSAARPPSSSPPVTAPGPLRRDPAPGDPVLRATRAALDAAHATAAPGAAPDLAVAVPRVTALVDALCNPDFDRLLDHVPALAWTQVRVGLTEEAGRLVDRGLVSARARLDVGARLLVVRAAALHRLGRFAEAARSGDEAAELADDLDLARIGRLARALATRARVAVQGPAALDGQDLSAPPPTTDPVVREAALVLAESCHLAGRPDAARAYLAFLRHRVVAVHPDARAVALEAVLQVEAGDPAGAARGIARIVDGVHLAADLPRVRWASSVVAAAGGDLGRARADAVAAVTAGESLGAPAAAARGRIQLAEVLRRDGDLAGAEREAGLAKAALQGLGAPFLAGLAVGVQRRIGAGRSRGLRAGEFGLSAREVEIAELVSAGLTNRRIATQLYLSVRTVDSHVARVLAKVGVPSRVALVHLFPPASDGHRTPDVSIA